MTPALLHRLILAVADEVIAHADELTELDQAVGDGDHGINMKRGFEAVRADAGTTAQKPPPKRQFPCWPRAAARRCWESARSGIWTRAPGRRR